MLGKINLNLSGGRMIRVTHTRPIADRVTGLGIRFDRDLAANTNVKMDTITVTGAGS